MFAKTLTKHEKQLIDNYIIKVADAGSTKTFSVALFNNAVCNTLPSFRAEELLNGKDKKTIAYIDYVKDLLRSQSNDK
jgi:hypothetical protein